MSDESTTAGERPRSRLLMDLYEHQKGKCYLCKDEMVLPRGYPNTATIDHIVPLAQRYTKPIGLWDAENLAAACQACNAEKGCLTLDIYLKSKQLSKIAEPPKEIVVSERLKNKFKQYQKWNSRPRKSGKYYHVPSA